MTNTIVFDIHFKQTNIRRIDFGTLLKKLIQMYIMYVNIPQMRHFKV